MKTKKLEDLQENYELELTRIVHAIKKEKVKRVLLQFPDAFKPYSTEVQKKLEELTENKTQFFIWFDSCYGACDIPIETEKLGIDLIVQFGHSDWNFSEKQDINVLKA